MNSKHILQFRVENQAITWVNYDRRPVEGSKKFVYAQFSVDEEWSGLTIYAVFEHKRLNKKYRVLWANEPVEIPPDILVHDEVYIGLVGIGCAGEEVITTQEMRLGIPIKKGTSPDGNIPDNCTPELWEQIVALIGPIDTLSTTSKNTLVSAINEIYCLCTKNEIKIDVVDGNIVWKAGDAEWKNVVSLDSLKGDKGEPGTPYKLTAKDKTVLVAAVLEALPNAEEVAF